MEVEEYARIAAAEDDHWWYRNTRAVMHDLLGPWLTRDLRILDAGCGPGGNGAGFAAHGDVTGVDLSPDALAFVRDRRPTTRPVRASLEALPLADATFDVVAAVTVLYCVPDDRTAVHELVRVLRPGGVLFCLEPAFEALRRAHDKTVHSIRRYRRRDLADAIGAAGCTVRRSTYLYSFLAPPAAVLGLAERTRPHTTPTAGSDVERSTLDPAFARASAVERRWLQHHGLPFGTSVALVATRD
ncbi:MAG: methyltransferase domain-containing protein [Actinomycetes bacterium]